ncbi:MAG: putative bifunctional diguanylate cyclase/phosphodiesterase [Gemmatimonadota bacterium]
MPERSDHTSDAPGGVPADALRAALERSADGVAVIGPGSRIAHANAAFARLLRYDAPEELEGLDLGVVHAADEEERLERMAAAVFSDAGSWRGEVMGRGRKGDPVPMDVTLTRIDDERLLYVARDLSERQELQGRLQQMAYYDPLTELANRRLLREKAEHAFALSRRHGHDVALIYLDLNSFKAINDSLGHAAGDQTLEEVARRLEQTVRDADTAARVGGDEFALLLGEVEGETGAVEVARRVMDRLDEPVEVDGHSLDVGASIGVALYPRYAPDFEELLRQADLAMYGAGRGKQAGIRIYRPEHGIVTPRDDQLFSELQEALRHYRFEVHYQPIRGLDSGRVEGAEALVRWPHPRLGTLSAAKFLPLIGEAGFLQRLDRWVLATAVLQLEEWGGSGFSGWVAVHLSEPTCASPGLVGYLERVFRSAGGIDPSRLVLQVPAGAPRDDPGGIRELRDRLSGLGTRVAVTAAGPDDPSVEALQCLHPEILSLDRTFVDAADREDTWRRELRVAVHRGHTLGAAVVGKGVERPTQRDILRDVGCDFAEGYLEGWSVPAEEFLDGSRRR